MLQQVWGVRNTASNKGVLPTQLLTEKRQAWHPWHLTEVCNSNNRNKHFIGQIHYFWCNNSFDTETYVTILSMNGCSITDVCQTPADHHKNIQEQMTRLTTLAQKVVGFAWLKDDWHHSSHSVYKQLLTTLYMLCTYLHWCTCNCI